MKNLSSGSFKCYKTLSVHFGILSGNSVFTFKNFSTPHNALLESTLYGNFRNSNMGHISLANTLDVLETDNISI